MHQVDAPIAHPSIDHQIARQIDALEEDINAANREIAAAKQTGAAWNDPALVALRNEKTAAQNKQSALIAQQTVLKQQLSSSSDAVVLTKLQSIERTQQCIESKLNHLSLISTNATPPSPSVKSPGHRAREVVEILKATGDDHVLGKDLLGNGASVLSESQQKEMLIAAHHSEEKMVAYITPHLAPLINHGMNSLVNSETKKWLVVKPGDSDLNRKPDLWSGPNFVLKQLNAPESKSTSGKEVAQYRQVVEQQLKQQDTPFKYVFGKVSYSSKIWYDSIFPIAAKTSLTDSAFGEEIEYLTILTDPNGVHHTVVAYGMVFDKEKFYLLTSQQGIITKRISAGWTTPGSADLITKHFSYESQWCRAIRLLCQRFNVMPIRHLGSGAIGRVIEVRLKHQCTKDTLVCSYCNYTCAMKVVLGKSIDQLATEYERLNLLISKHQPSSPSSSSSSFSFSSPSSSSSFPSGSSVLPTDVSAFERVWTDEDETDCIAGGFLIEPIGQSILHSQVLNSEEIFTDVFNALRILHANGICHGDPRLPNLLKRPNTDQSNPIVDSTIVAFTSSTTSTTTSWKDIRTQLQFKRQIDTLHDSPSPLYPYFWVDFMLPDLSSLTHSNTTRFHSDLRLFMEYIIGHKIEPRTNEDQQLKDIMLNPYQPAADFQSFQKYAKNVYYTFVSKK